METIGQLIENSSQEHGPRLALKMRSGLRLEKYSYDQLWKQARCMAGFLQDRGMDRGDRVLLWAPNSPSWVIAYLGILLGGGVAVPLDMGSTPGFAAGVVAQTEPVLALVSHSVREAVQGLPVPVLAVEDLPRLLGHAQETLCEPTVKGEDLAQIMYTSGTTGEPKGVMLTHRNLICNVETGRETVPLDPESTVLSLLPLSHMLEQIVGMLIPLRSGANIIYLPSRQSNIILQALRREGISAMVLVPQALQMLMSHIEREVDRRGGTALWRLAHRVAPSLPIAGRKLLFRSVHRQLGGNLQFLACGGAFLDPSLARKWENLGVPILQGYGTTEATAMVTLSSLDDRRLGTVGRVPRGQELTIAADGEILIRGENVSSGYWHNPVATEEAYRDGWYCTGDLGYLDPYGYLHFRGRKKNLIVLADGMNVYPEDIENQLNLRPEILEAVVVGLPQDDGRIQVHAVVLAADPDGVDAAIREANSLLAPHQQIRGYSIWPGEDLPRTHTLKVKRHEVLTVLDRAGKVAPNRAVVAKRQATTDLRDLVAQVAGVPREEIDSQSSLGLDLGLDSLSIVELLCLIEEEMGLCVAEGGIPHQATVGDLEAVLADVRTVEPSTSFQEWRLCFPAKAARTLFQRGLMAPLLGLLCPTQVRGVEILNDLQGPFLLTANHTSHLDTLTVLKVLPRKHCWRVSVAAAADYWFASPLLGSLSALAFNSFPMVRRGNVRPSMEHTVDLIDRGWSVLIFPEGTRSLSGEMQPFKPGVGLLAVETGVPVVPMYLRGVHAVLPKGAQVPRRGPVEVIVGAPLRFPPATDHTWAAQQLERETRNLAN